MRQPRLSHLGGGESGRLVVLDRGSASELIQLSVHNSMDLNDESNSNLVLERLCFREFFGIVLLHCQFRNWECWRSKQGSEDAGPNFENHKSVSFVIHAVSANRLVCC